MLYHPRRSLVRGLLAQELILACWLLLSSLVAEAVLLCPTSQRILAVAIQIEIFLPTGAAAMARIQDLPIDRL